MHRKIPSLVELENEVKLAVPNAEDGLNLSVLLTSLVPAPLIQEADTHWTFDTLLREITDELSNIPKTIVPGSAPAASSSTSHMKGNIGSQPNIRKLSVDKKPR